MKSYINLLTILLLFPVFVSAQKKKNNLPPPAPTSVNYEVEIGKNDCLHRETYSAEQRKSFYPFNKTDNVLLISFQNHDELLPMENGKVSLKKMREIITLKANQVDSLTDILYNFGPKEKSLFPVGEAACYMPHNAILFADKKGDIFEFIEICFDCGKNRLSSKKIKLGESCNEKYELLEQLFKKFGIKYTGPQFN